MNMNLPADHQPNFPLQSYSCKQVGAERLTLRWPRFMETTLYFLWQSRMVSSPSRSAIDLITERCSTYTIIDYPGLAYAGW